MFLLIQLDNGLVQHKSGLAKHILKLQDLKQVRRLTDVFVTIECNLQAITYQPLNSKYAYHVSLFLLI